jgi:regulatory protein
MPTSEPNITEEKLVEQQALAYLQNREYTPLLLQRKLQQKGFSMALIQLSLQRLSEKGWLSEARFTEGWLARRLRQGYGPIRIEMELRQQGVTETTIKDQFAEISEARWLDSLGKALQRKFPISSTQTAPTLQQTKYLHYRGFTREQMKAYLQSYNKA